MNLIINNQNIENISKIQYMYSIYEKQYSKFINNFINLNTMSKILNTTTNKHTLFINPLKSGVICPAVYIVKHCQSNKIIVGSTKDINNRVSNYQATLNRNIFRIKEFQELYNNDNNIDFCFILLDDREEAYNIEQWLLDRYWYSGFLLNRSPCSKSNIGTTRSDEEKQKMRLRQLGIKHSEERNFKKSQIQSIPIYIDDILYHGIKNASKQLNVSKNTIQFRLNSPYFLNYKYKDKKVYKKDSL